MLHACRSHTDSKEYTVYVIRLTIVEIGHRYSTCPNKDLVGVISLIKGLIGGQVGANHRLVSGGNRGYEVGLGQGQALGLDCCLSTGTMIGQTTYIQQTVLLNTPSERKLDSETEPSLRHGGRQIFKKGSPIRTQTYWGYTILSHKHITTAETSEWSIQFSNDRIITLQGNDI